MCSAGKQAVNESMWPRAHIMWVFVAMTVFVAWSVCGEHNVLTVLPSTVVSRLGEVNRLKGLLAEAELKTIGTLCEEISIDVGAYPGKRGSIAPFREQLQLDVASDVLQDIPAVDPWGERYMYYTNGNGYLVVSSGPNRRLDQRYSELGSNPSLTRASMCG